LYPIVFFHLNKRNKKLKKFQKLTKGTKHKERKITSPLGERVRLKIPPKAGGGGDVRAVEC